MPLIEERTRHALSGHRLNIPRPSLRDRTGHPPVFVMSKTKLKERRIHPND